MSIEGTGAAIAPGFLPKVLLPRRRPDVLARPRLIDFLSQNLDRRLLIVCAPAGYGKTTLLVDFVHRSGLTVCWLALTPSESDSRNLLEGLVASVRRRFPTFGAHSLRYLRSSGARDLEVAVGILVEELNDLTEDTVLLVLDDVHLVDSETAVQNVLNGLIAGLPSNFCCIMISRTIPRIRISRLVANREAAGLGAGDLRFTAAEIKQLFSRHLQLVVPDQVVDELVEEAEGWIAGIILTSHVLWDGLVKNLIQSKGSTTLFDYLASEVFEVQEPAVRSFLLGSSILPRLSTERCDRLLDRSDSAQMLTRLEERNLFLARLEGDADWYRYHSLFAEFLRRRLSDEAPEELARLERKAGHLAELDGDFDDAVDHFLRAGDPVHAADLVEREAASAIAAGRIRTILHWCARLPPRLVAERPGLLVQQARAAFEARDLNLMQQALDAAEAATRTDEHNRARIEVLAWRSLPLRAEGRSQEAIESCRSALDLASQRGEPDLIALCAKQLGVALAEAGKNDEAIPALERARETYAQLGDEYNQGIVCHSLGLAWKQAGQFDHARDYLDRAADHWRRVGNGGMLAMTLVVRGNLSYAVGLIEDATTILTEAQRQAQESGYLRIEGYATQSLGEVLRDRGDLAAATALFEAALASAERIGDRRLQVVVLEALARAQLYADNLDGALATVLRSRTIAAERDSTFEQGLAEATYGLVLVQLGQSRDGITALATAADLLQKSGSVQDLARARLHHAALTLAGTGATNLDRAAEDLATLGSPDQPVLLAEARYLTPLLRAVEPFGPPWIGLILRRLPQEEAPPRTSTGPKLRLIGARHVRSYSLGRCDVELDGRLIEPSDWASLRSRDLWFYLLAHGPSPKEQIVEALWPEMPIENGLNAFHQSLHRLRRSLFPECVARVGQLWRVSESVETWSDDREFDRIAQESRTGSAPLDDDTDQLVLAERALGLYRGVYLPHLDAEWVQKRRRRLQAAFLRLARATIEGARGRAEHERVIHWSERFLEVEPDDEAIHEALMRALAESGNALAALRHFQQYAKQLREELDVEPPRRLVLLSQQISRGR